MSKSMRIILGLTIVLALAGTTRADRAHDPWVLRTTLDGRPHILVVALHEEMWVTYDVSRNALFKVLKDGINFIGGPVYTWAHGPMPLSYGSPYWAEPADPTWRVVDAAGNDLLAEIAYTGHRLDGDDFNIVYLLHSLTLADGTTVRVEERPEVSTLTPRGLGLIRLFAVSGLPDGAAIHVTLPADIAPESVDVQHAELAVDEGGLALVLSSDGIFIATMFVD